jgi:hypothetical protein
MAGNTGKMTAEAIRQRGPRKALMRVDRNGSSFKVICIPGLHPFNDRARFVGTSIFVVAQSYSTSYLRGVGRAN